MVGECFAPALCLSKGAVMQTVETVGGQWALKRCTAGCWIPTNGRICDQGEEYIV